MIREDIADARHTVDEMGNLLSASVSPSRPRSNPNFQPLDDSIFKDHRGSDGSSLSPVRRYKSPKDSNDEKRRGRERKMRSSSPLGVASEESSRKSKIKEPIIKVPKSREESSIKYPSIKKKMIPRSSLLEVKRFPDQKKSLDKEEKKIKSGKRILKDEKEDHLSMNQSESDSDDSESSRSDDKTKQKKFKKDKIKKFEEDDRKEKKNKLEKKPTKKSASEKRGFKNVKRSHNEFKDQSSSTESESNESEEAIESDYKKEKYKKKKRSCKKIGEEKTVDLKNNFSDDFSDSKKLKNKKIQSDVRKKTFDKRNKISAKDIDKSYSSDDDRCHEDAENKKRENVPRNKTTKSKDHKIKKLKSQQKKTETKIKDSKPNLKEKKEISSSNCSDSTNDYQEDDEDHRKVKKDQKQRSELLSSSSEDDRSCNETQQRSSEDESSQNKSVNPKIKIEDEYLDEDSESSDLSDKRSRRNQKKMKIKNEENSVFVDPSNNVEKNKTSKKEESSKKGSKNKKTLFPKSSEKIKKQQTCDNEDLKDNLTVEDLIGKKSEPADTIKENQSTDSRNQVKKDVSSEEDLIEETQVLKPITESQIIAEEMNNLQYISNDSAVSSADEVIGSSLKNSSTFNDTGLGLSLPLPQKSNSPTKQSTNQIRDDTEFEISELFPMEDSKPMSEDDDTVVDLPKIQESKSIPQHSLSKSSHKNLMSKTGIDDSKLKKESSKDVRKITDHPTHLSVSLDDLKELLQINKNELPSLLPDDRPSLVHEVTKARAEAKKWFEEVTKSDRDKRDMKRRMKEMESELDRLRAVEEK